MGLRYVEANGVGFVEGRPATPFMQAARDVNALLEGCFSNRTGSALLYSSNLSPAFFDVSSLEAGELLQKLRQYRIRLAVVREPGVGESRRFSELLAAERRDGYFAVFDERSAAEVWLCDRIHQTQGDQ